MSKNLADLSQINEELNGALSLLQERLGDLPIKESTHGNLVKGTSSLLQRCANVFGEEKKAKPVIRVIHHFACSGGTLFSKCIAALPNVFLLSELHPSTRLGITPDEPMYTPRDIITQAIYGKLPEIDELIAKVFVAEISKVSEHVGLFGGSLVIRAHSHADYCTEATPPEVDTITRLLAPHFELKQLVTVRNPIDAFISLRQNDWVHFSPDLFEEYCERFRRFLDGFEQAEIVHYEDLVASPDATIKHCTELLELAFTEDIFEYLDIFRVSGDSGRSGNKIAPRPRKTITNEYRQEIMSSSSFRILCEQYGFDENI